MRTCPDCNRGPEACEWCNGVEQADWETICDCGLYDFGAHLGACKERADKRYVVAQSYESAQLPRV